MSSSVRNLRLVPLFLVLFVLLVGSSLRSQTIDQRLFDVREVAVRCASPFDSIINSLAHSAHTQRLPEGVVENIPNTVSNVEMYFTNDGRIGLHPQVVRAGGTWPRGSGNGYIFGGGIWFGAKKLSSPPDGSTLRKMSIVSYNPNTGGTWMVPGRIPDPYRESAIDQSLWGISHYRVFRSSDYDRRTGESLDSIDAANDGPRWPIWDTDPLRTLRRLHYFGNYVEDPAKRTPLIYEKGPAILSDEDIATVFRDTDLSRNELGANAAREAGYPLGIQFEQTVYSWGFGVYKDILIVRYRIINRSPDALFECWAAPVIDLDIGGAFNDRTKAAILNAASDSLNLALGWSEPEVRELGYFGCDILESPAIDNAGFIRRDKEEYSGEEQLGLATLRNWVIDIDPNTPEERYDFMAAQTLDDDNGPGDKRFLAATGPFNMRPGDTAHVAIALLFAPSPTGRPNGEWEDMVNLIELDRFAQMIYDAMMPTSAVEDGWDAWRPSKGPDLR